MVGFDSGGKGVDERRETVLTAEESAELEGLRAWNKKGKLEPGSVGLGRMLALIRMEETGERVVVEAKRWGRVEVLAFYGVKDRFFYEMRGLGEKTGVAVPWEDPEALVRWFEIMKGKGERKHPPPLQIVERAEAARIAKMRVGGVLPPPAVAAPVVLDGGQVPLRMDAEVKSGDVLANKRRLVAGLTEEYHAYLRAGKRDQAAAIGGELNTQEEILRKWELASGKMRQADEAHEAEITRTMAHVATVLWTAVRKALLQGLSAEALAETETRLNTVAAALPAMLAAELNLPVASAA